MILNLVFWIQLLFNFLNQQNGDKILKLKSKKKEGTINRNKIKIKQNKVKKCFLTLSFNGIYAKSFFNLQTKYFSFPLFCIHFLRRLTRKKFNPPQKKKKKKKKKEKLSEKTLKICLTYLKWQVNYLLTTYKHDLCHEAIRYYWVWHKLLFKRTLL